MTIRTKAVCQGSRHTVTQTWCRAFRVSHAILFTEKSQVILRVSSPWWNILAPLLLSYPITSVWFYPSFSGTTFDWGNSPYKTSRQCVLWIIQGHWIRKEIVPFLFIYLIFPVLQAAQTKKVCTYILVEWRQEWWWRVSKSQLCL